MIYTTYITFDQLQSAHSHWMYYTPLQLPFIFVQFSCCLSLFMRFFCFTFILINFIVQIKLNSDSVRFKPWQWHFFPCCFQYLRRVWIFFVSCHFNNFSKHLINPLSADFVQFERNFEQKKKEKTTNAMNYCLSSISWKTMRW